MEQKENEKINSKRGKIIIYTTIIVVVAILVGLVIYFATKSDDNDSYSKYHTQNTKTIDETTNSQTKKSAKKNPSLNDTFVFDDLEITIGNEISFTKINNRYSDNNGKEVIKMPITVKNIKDETHGLNMFDYTVFGSQGTETDTVSSYFDESIDYAGDLRPGASYTKYLYFIYDGNGEYAIEFDDWDNKITIEFNVEK